MVLSRTLLISHQTSYEYKIPKLAVQFAESKQRTCRRSINYNTTICFSASLQSQIFEEVTKYLKLSKL